MSRLLLTPHRFILRARPAPQPLSLMTQPRFPNGRHHYSTSRGPIITLEEHFTSPKVLQQSVETWRTYQTMPQVLNDKLSDLGSGRIQDLDNGSVSLQVLSHGTGSYSVDDCVQGNNDLAAAIAQNPSRLAGFAMLPMTDPAAAVAELERCVTKLGFVGALIDNHQRGQFYDGDEFLPVFEKAVELDVPLYLHPCYASEDMMHHYKGNYSDTTAQALSSSGWGWHADTGLHILRLFCSGLFDRLPTLKLVIGHMGEMLPFQLERIAGGEAYLAGKRERHLREVWRTNVWVTTSGMFSLRPLACLLQSTTPDHVLFSVDYPFSSNETGLKFLDEVEKSDLMTAEEFEGFTHKNAENLLKIKVSK